MRSILSIFSIVACFALSAQSAPTQLKGGNKVEIRTSAVCDMCKEAIEYDLTFEKGVKSAILDVDTKVLTVVYKPNKTTADNIRRRVTMVGYNADDFERDTDAYNKLPECCKDGAHGDGPHEKH